MDKIGLLYHPKIVAARTVVQQLSAFLDSNGVASWGCSSWDEAAIRDQSQGTGLAVSVGGDGTILRVARAVTPMSIPILGVNLGHLGFMTEFSAEEIVARMPSVLKGEGWVDRRMMLQVEILRRRSEDSESPSPEPFYALNDAIVGRGGVSRVVYVEATIDGESLTTYKADGVLVSTATGSTGYSLAAGGPILFPQSQDILVKSVCPHLTMGYALVLPPTATVELKVRTDHEAMLSIDGQLQFSLDDGDMVAIRRSPYSASFMRLRPNGFFYSTLEERLRLRK